MSGKSKTIATGDVKDLADRLLMSGPIHADMATPCGQAIFWLGAGASVSAGIPSGHDLSGRLAHRLAISLGLSKGKPDDPQKERHEKSFAVLKAKGKIGAGYSLGQAYGELFGLLTAPQQRNFIRTVISKTNKRKINWAHIALGELVRRRYVHTILTTNFDDLALDGLVRCDLLPAIIDGIESLNRLDAHPPVPQLVYLHGSQHTYSPRNSTAAVSETSGLPPAQGGLYSLLQHCSVLVVVGYAGNPGEGVMELLVNASETLQDLCIYWVAHGQHDSLSDAARELLSTGRNKWLLPGQDADQFFYDLLRVMQIGVPEWFRDPIKHLIASSHRISVTSGEERAHLSAEVKVFQTRLEALHPHWKKTSRNLKLLLDISQFAARNQNKKIWEALKDRRLNSVDLLRFRANAALQLGTDGSEDTLSQAIRDFRSLLRKLPARHTDWAVVQNSLGNALAATISHQSHPMLSAEQAKENERLRDAIDAYQAALDVFQDDADRTAWAKTMNNMGNAWALLGRWGDEAALGKAIEAFEATMEVHSPQAMPQEWAATLANLGGAYCSRGMNGDSSSLQRAANAFKSALQVITQQTNRHHWASITANLAHALLALGKLGDEASLTEAISKYREATEVFTKNEHRSAYEHCMEGIRAAEAELRKRQAQDGSSKPGDVRDPPPAS